MSAVILIGRFFFNARGLDRPTGLGVGTTRARLHSLQGRNHRDWQLAGRRFPRFSDQDGVPQPHLHAVGERRGAKPQQACAHPKNGDYQWYVAHHAVTETMSVFMYMFVSVPVIV